MEILEKPPISRINRRASGFTFIELIAILVLLAIAWGVGYGFWHHHIKKEAEQAAARETELRKPLVVKGLYVGMAADEIPQAVQDKFDSTWHVYKHTDPRSLEITTDQLNPLSTDGDYSIILTFDDDQKVNSIIFGPNCSKLLFDSGGMEGEQFVKTFIDAYHIEQMDGGSGCWYYANPYNNTTLKITTEKAVLLYKGADAQDVQQKFN